MPQSAQSALHPWSLLIHAKMACGCNDHNLHFSEQETEAERDWVTGCLIGLKLRLSSFQGVGVKHNITLLLQFKVLICSFFQASTPLENEIILPSKNQKSNVVQCLVYGGHLRNTWWIYVWMNERKGPHLRNKKVLVSLRHQEKGQMSRGRDSSHFKAADVLWGP